MLFSDNPLQAVWRNRSDAVVIEFASKIPEARFELWRRRLGELLAAECRVGKLARYKARCGKVAVMAESLEQKKTFMTNPPEPGELFIFTDGTVPDLDADGNPQYDAESGAQIMKPNRINAYCVEVAPLPGGGGMGQGGMFVVTYIPR